MRQKLQIVAVRKPVVRQVNFPCRQVGRLTLGLPHYNFRHGIMNANQIHKLKLEEFWNQFGGRKTDGVGFKTSDKLEALKRLAVFVVPFKRQSSIQDRRAAFEESKAILHKLWTHRNRICFCCGHPPTARHHIIQIQNGGLNCRKNVVSLCDECHAEIHPWLGNARTSQLTGQQEKENVRALCSGLNARRQRADTRTGWRQASSVQIRPSQSSEPCGFPFALFLFRIEKSSSFFGGLVSVFSVLCFSFYLSSYDTH